MASKLAVYETGYEDERFEHIVSQSFHCIVCTNVIKDPVMCPQNEHLFCRACITAHLMYSQTCPTCMQPLTVDTLSQASRGIRNLLAELKIRCDFFDRGCRKIVDLGDLERHVADCGFAPAVCSNEGCQLEVNKQDLLHHETALCERRRVQCHSCNDIRRELDRVTLNLATMNEKLLRIEKNFVGKFEEVQRRLEADNVEIKKSFGEITKQLERMAQPRLCEIQAKEIKNETAEANIHDRKSFLNNDEHVSPNFLQKIEFYESLSSSDEDSLGKMYQTRNRQGGRGSLASRGGRGSLIKLRGGRGGFESRAGRGSFKARGNGGSFKSRDDWGSFESQGGRGSFESRYNGVSFESIGDGDSFESIGDESSFELQGARDSLEFRGGRGSFESRGGRGIFKSRGGRISIVRPGGRGWSR